MLYLYPARGAGKDSNGYRIGRKLWDGQFKF